MKFCNNSPFLLIKLVKLTTTHDNEVKYIALLLTKLQSQFDVKSHDEYKKNRKPVDISGVSMDIEFMFNRLVEFKSMTDTSKEEVPVDEYDSKRHLLLKFHRSGEIVGKENANPEGIENQKIDLLHVVNTSALTNKNRSGIESTDFLVNAISVAPASHVSFNV